MTEDYYFESVFKMGVYIVKNVTFLRIWFIPIIEPYTVMMV